MLQAYREVFEYLIEDFKTYKPLLSAVKNEYEMMLSYQRETIRQMEPLKVAHIFVFLLTCAVSCCEIDLTFYLAEVTLTFKIVCGL